MRLKNSILLIFLILVLIFFAVFNNRENISEDQIEKITLEYLESLKYHDIEMHNSIVGDNLKIDVEKDDPKYQTFYAKIIDCQLEDIDFSSKKSENDLLVVPITYILELSEDFIPIGTLEPGTNKITELFTFEKDADNNIRIVNRELFY